MAVVGAYSANQQNKAAKGAANASRDANQAAIDEQRRQYDQSRQDMLPFLDAGKNALGLQDAILNGDFSAFQNSPDYKFALDQGMQSLDRSAAARGRLMSGGYGADLTKYAQGMATQNLNNYWSKLAGMAGQSYSAASNLGQLGQGMANSIGNAYNNIGNARASSYQNIANTNSQYAGMLGGLMNSYFQNRNMGGY